MNQWTEHERIKRIRWTLSPGDVTNAIREAIRKSFHVSADKTIEVELIEDGGGAMAWWDAERHTEPLDGPTPPPASREGTR